MDGRCKGCKWWERVSRYTPHPYDDVVAIRHGYGVCSKIEDGTDFNHYREDAEQESVLTENMAFTMDGSGYRSSIFTGPDFGCVKFEPKG